MSTPDDDALRSFAAAITLPRAEFEQIYDELAIVHGARLFKIAALLSPQAPFFNALQTARDGVWFDDLAVRLTAVDAFRQAPDAAPVPDVLRADLQAIVSPLLGMIDMDHLNKGGINAIKRVCRVEVLDHAGTTGTGFLIGPQAVLTARHVVANLLDPDGFPLPGSDQQLRIIFGDVGRMAAPRSCGVDHVWLIGSSACHDLEAPDAPYPDLTAAPPESFADRLDYAIIRLDSPLGQARGYYRLDPACVPLVGRPGAQLSLYQHPMGAKMHMTLGTGLSLWPDMVKTRLRHDANSVPGTSGGLIVNRNFEPVAMHQCGYIDADGVARVNGAIPTACIAAHHDMASTITVTGFEPLRRVEATGHPVIGRRNFQQQVLVMMTGGRRIQIVRGAEDSGKSFSIQILRTMLDEPSHVIVEYSASGLSLDAMVFARNLLRQMFGADANPNDLPAREEADTAPEAWLRDLLLPALLRRLEDYAGDRIIWLVIDDLDRHPVPQGSSTASLLERLFVEIASYPFLRIVLIGQTGQPSGAPLQQLIEDRLLPLTQDELEDYINLRFVATGTDKSLAEVATLATTYMGIAQDLPLPYLPALLSTLTAGLKVIDGGDL